MYVLCTLVLLSLHSLFRRPKVQESSEPKAIEGPEQHSQDVAKLGRKKRNKHPLPGSSGALEISRVPRQNDFERCLDGPSRASKRRSFHLDNVHERRKRAQLMFAFVTQLPSSASEFGLMGAEEWCQYSR
ncbi:hypothetical protein DPX16_8427 [Anabarilius grahami]|uniref:Uncharacterized protein n=1 Tax=Anabarilius grahami TaxID=495550 RepID=A0A3N0Z3W2_ANAGA|nr:hypothetical protein DPX16_8427 [Anabarilius grahami]